MNTLAEIQNQAPDCGDWLPPAAPRGWYQLERFADGASYRCHGSQCTAFVTCDREDDGKRWVHLSIAHAKRLPSCQELKQTKVAFLGNGFAVQLFAPPSQHVNIHPYALHLWRCLDGWTLPDFTRGSGSI